MVSLAAFSESPLWDIYIVPSDGGVAENVCAECGEATDWSQDGKRIIGNTLNGQAFVLDPRTQHPMGEPFQLLHAHSPRFLLASEQELSIAGSEMVLGMTERTGNI
jgi:hypothetical protein